MLAKDRWFTAGAVLTLALAMGVANTTFIMTYARLMRDLPFERVIDYYAEERTGKIVNRRRLASTLGLSDNALRSRV